MIYLLLFYEFFKTGLLAVGGGLATLPFVYDMAARYSWISAHDVTNMIAVAESTPGPIGVNVATFAGYHAAGPLGGIVATLALVLPSIIIIVSVSRFLIAYQEHRLVKSAFWTLRPAALGLIGASFFIVLTQVFWFSDTGGGFFARFQWREALLFALIFPAIRRLKWHPLVWIALSACIGLVHGLVFGN